MSLDNCPSSAPGADHRGPAWVLAGGGVAASLALIACCALPPLLAGVGLAGWWTLEVQTFLGPYELLSLWLALVGLGSGAAAWAWQLRRSRAGCVARGCRWSLTITPLMLVIGAILTWIALHPI